MKDFDSNKIAYDKFHDDKISNNVKTKLNDNEKELAKLDNAYNREYQEHVKNCMFDYSVDSDIVNDCLRNHNGLWNFELEKKYGINSTEFNNMVKDLDNNQVKLVKNTTLYLCF